MLVTIQGSLERTEHQLATYLEQLDKSLPGFAVFNIWVPVKDRDSRQVDAILWTPQRCIVVEVKGFNATQSGALTASANGVWRVDGATAALYSLSTADGKGTVNPFQQVRERAFEVKDHLSRRGFGTRFVDGLVVLYKQPGCTITIDTVSPPRGTRLVVTDANQAGPIRRQLAAFSRGKARWTANDIMAVLTSLNLPDAVSINELIAAGFPEYICDDGAVETSPPTVAQATAAIDTTAADDTADNTPQPEPAPATTELDATAPTTAPPVATAQTPIPSTPTPVPMTAWSTSPTLPPPLTLPRSPYPAAPLPRPRRPSGVSRPIRTRSIRKVIRVVVVIGLLGTAAALTPSLLTRLAASEDPVKAPVSFTTPSQNIACTIGSDAAGDFVRCDVAEYTYAVPPPENGCAPQDWGHTFLIRRGADAKFACAADFLIGQGFPEQGYGTTAAAGRFSCSITEEAVTCNERNAASFRISRDHHSITR
ncbi:NERD domain-containing protein [Rhodococcus sp. TAF43]|uniref:NERD domain-containing protein n=1 Tax=Rhodococcus sp. TAF43 TaxID=3237483 RepID=UPI003F9A4897